MSGLDGRYGLAVLILVVLAFFPLEALFLSCG